MLKTPDRVISRDEARVRKLTWYFTGQPCVRGHVAVRNYCNHSCRACQRKETAVKVKLTAKQERAALHRAWEEERKAKRAERLRDSRSFNQKLLDKQVLDLLS